MKKYINMPKFPVNNLKQIRKKKGIGQSELANDVGVSKQLLSGFENQRSGISNTVISKLSIFLNVPIEKIVSQSQILITYQNLYIHHFYTYKYFELSFADNIFL
jgi:transcriptional regulator with XRE-family HTH domain